MPYFASPRVRRLSNNQMYGGYGHANPYGPYYVIAAIWKD